MAEGGPLVSALVITFAGRRRSFAAGQSVRIGRSPDNSIVVPDPIVSREHAQIRWLGDGWALDDLGKGRTFVGGMPVSSVPVQNPLEIHLASPLGPSLRIEVEPDAAADANGAATSTPATSTAGEPVGWGEFRGRDSDAAQSRTGLTELAGQSGDSGPRTGSWLRANTGQHVGPSQESSPNQDRPDAPGGDFATAVHILVPVRSWLKHPGWKQGSRLLVLAYGLLPSLFVVLLSTSTSETAPGWAYSLAIAPLWAVAFWVLIRPGHITRLIAWLAALIIAAVMILLPVMTFPWEQALDNTGNGHNPLPWFYGVGLAEEVTKALPILIAALALRWIWNITLDVRIWMFLGTMAGLAFGVRESVLYTGTYLNNFAQAGQVGGHGQTPVVLILTFALRVFVDGFQHAVWAGISAFFIGMGVNYRRRRIPLIAFGLLLPAVLHALYDWSTKLAYGNWLWIGMEALSMVLFLGYSMSAATIERQVRDTPLFRGESMLMDRARISGDSSADGG